MLALACSSSPLVKELEDFCRVVNEVDRQASMSPEDKLSKITARKTEFVHAASPKPDSVWAKLDQAPADQRYGMLTSAAQSAGKSDWSCKVYDRIVKQAEAARLIREQRERDEKEKQAAAAAAAAEPKKEEPAPAPAKKTKKARHKKRHR